MITVLITGCSRHSKGIVDSLKNNEDKIKVRVVGVDCNEMNLLRVGVDASYVVPRITEPDYFEKLLFICQKEDVDVIIPYITAELPLIAAKRDMFEEVGIKVSVASPVSLKIANDKIELAKWFPEYMPRQTVAHNVDDVTRFAEEIGYPENKFCCKLSSKCGGAGFAIVDDEKAYDITTFNRLGFNRYVSFEELVKIIEKNDLDIILQEYVEGVDYSVTVLAEHGAVKYMCGFAGYTMEYGAVVTGEIIKHEKAYQIAEKVCMEIGLDGNACFDFIVKDGGESILLEINPRINASLPFVSAAGLNLPFLRCKQLLGLPIKDDYEIKYGLRMNKYYESEYFV